MKLDIFQTNKIKWGISKLVNVFFPETLIHEYDL